MDESNKAWIIGKIFQEQKVLASYLKKPATAENLILYAEQLDKVEAYKESLCELNAASRK